MFPVVGSVRPLIRPLLSVRPTPLVWPLRPFLRLVSVIKPVLLPRPVSISRSVIVGRSVSISRPVMVGKGCSFSICPFLLFFLTARLFLFSPIFFCFTAKVFYVLSLSVILWLYQASYEVSFMLARHDVWRGEEGGLERKRTPGLQVSLQRTRSSNLRTEMLGLRNGPKLPRTFARKPSQQMPLGPARSSTELKSAMQGCNLQGTYLVGARLHKAHEDTSR